MTTAPIGIGKLANQLITENPASGANSLDLTSNERQQLNDQLGEIRTAFAANDLPTIRQLAGVPTNVPDSLVKHVALRRLERLKSDVDGYAGVEAKQASDTLSSMQDDNLKRHDLTELSNDRVSDSSSASQLRMLGNGLDNTINALRPRGKSGVRS